MLATPLRSAAAIVVVVFLGLIANGRPIGAGDTRPTERVAASLVREGDFDLDEYPEVRAPFAREEGEHRVSVYPVLSAILATPVFAAAGALFPLDEQGSALAGKLAAALLSSLAAATLFLALWRRRPYKEARCAALLFAFATSVWATSQALWQHPAAVLFLSLSLFAILKAEEDAVWAGRVGLPLVLTVAARHASVALVAVLGLGVALRWPRRLPWLLLWALPGVCAVLLYQWLYFGSPLRHGFSGGLDRFAAPWGVGHLGLLVSPGKGLLVFTPLVLVALLGLLRALWSGDRWLATTLLLASVAHWLLVGRWLEWHGGECWGPRMMTETLPLLFLFLPEGLERLPRLGAAAAAFSVAVQALGVFAYDYRWERLYQRPPTAEHRELWQPSTSPILFHLRERVLILALPELERGRVTFAEHRFVPFGRSGSRIEAVGDRLAVGGEQALVRDVHLLRAARAADSRIRLRRRWDGVFLRLRSAVRDRRLEVNVVGRGHGTLYVGERSFGSATRWTAYPLADVFAIRHPYHGPESNGPELIVTIGKAHAQADIVSITVEAAATS
jgi:hypothetical protein